MNDELEGGQPWPFKESGDGGNYAHKNCPKCGRDYFQNETILKNGELGCDCQDAIFTVETDGKNIIVKLPISFLAYTQKYRPEEQFFIVDEKEMAEYFKKNFLDFVYGRSSTEGNEDSNFQELIDDFFSYAYEYGENWMVCESEIEDDEEDS
jgi:hypothetical protein